MRTFKTPKQMVTRLAFSPCSTRLAAGGVESKVCLWNVTGAKVKPTTLTFDSRSSYLTFLPNGKLFGVSERGLYATYDPETGADVRGNVPLCPGTFVPNADFTAFYGGYSEARKWSYNGKALKKLWEHELPGEWHGSDDCGVLNARGEYLTMVTRGNECTNLHTRDPETGELLETRKLSSSSVRVFRLLPDSCTVAFVRDAAYTGSATNAVMIGPLNGRFEPLVKAKAREKYVYTSLAVHPNGSRLAVGCGDGTVKTFDTKSWREVSAHKWFKQGVWSIAFAPNGLTAAAGSLDGAVVVWDAE